MSNTGEDVEQTELSYITSVFRVCKLVQPFWKIVQQFHIKLNIHLPYAPEIPLLGIYLRNKNTYPQKGFYLNAGSRFTCDSPKLKQFNANVLKQVNK